MEMIPQNKFSPIKIEESKNKKYKHQLTILIWKPSHFCLRCLSYIFWCLFSCFSVLSFQLFVACLDVFIVMVPVILVFVSTEIMFCLNWMLCTSVNV